MNALRSENWNCPSVRNHINTGMLRQWSSPKIILVVTDLSDVESIQFHTIQHARPGAAKVLLVEASGRSNVPARAQNLHRKRSIGSIHTASDTAGGMASHLRRFAIDCEPVFVRGLEAEEIPSIARSCSADRVLVSAPLDKDPSAHKSVADRIIDDLEIPVCVVGRDLSLFSRYQRPSRRITLALSLHGRNEIPIAFSSRLAQENHSQLTIMHVFPKGTGNRRRMEEMQTSFVSCLPSVILKEAQLLCPVGIAIREGDPTAEILNYEAQLNQDFLVLAPSREGDLIGLGVGAVRRIIREARCPVIVLGEQADAHDGSRRVAQELCSARGQL